ncbi:MAG: hypothetical protein F6K54_16425 [Okeania sp. SIO3B5]|uniref:NB-ARC domain-containing protein n=1 Tax=Okeania sp. SIO3B5 TaxID=2607811 RepID=UPI001400EEF4|nr:NB-ARC domain-containing protein [Okeania sp. SIO3B5]NEO54527.1 hypothetical protein [Okeania sp. SIO3B5]
MAPTLRASQKGLKKVDIARRKKGWRTDALAWYSAAQTTLATLKRFRRGEAIQRDAFIGICKAVGIDNWEDIVDESEVDCVDSDSGGDIDLATWQKEKRYGQFVGRTDELDEILKSLESEEKIKVLSIVGIGGLGKTALCHQLAYQAYQAKVFTKIVWVRGKIYQYQTDFLGKSQSQRESKLTFEDALTAIGEELKIRNCNLQQSDRLKTEIYNILNKNRHLIVIDGLEDTESPTILANQLQSILGKSCLILTSRKQPDADIFRYPIRKLNPEISKEFIEVVAEEKYYIPSQNPIKNLTEQQLQEIIRITDGMPLAMKLTVSQAGFLEFDRIIERLGSVSEEQELYDYLFEDSWNELERENEFNTQKLLVCLSFNHLLEPTPIHILYDLAELKKSDIDKAIEKLVNLSLVDIVPGKEGRKLASLHSFTARYFGETLRKKYEK